MHRMTLELPDRARARLEKLQAKTEASSMTEVIRRALAIYETVIDQDLRGSKLLVEAPDGTIRQLVVAP